VNSANLTPAVVVGVYNVGHLPDLYSEEQSEIVIVAIETASRTHYLKCDLPVGAGGTIHRLAEVTSGNSLQHRDVKPGDILGKAVLVELVPSESFSALRRCQPFPSAPKFSAPGFRFVSSDAQLTGRKNGVVTVVGGSRPVTDATFPAPPAPRSSPRAWSVSDLREAKLPQGLPAIVAQFVMRSTEFRELESAETPAPAKRK
jgi:hypothetical protein